MTKSDKATMKALTKKRENLGGMKDGLEEDASILD